MLGDELIKNLNDDKDFQLFKKWLILEIYKLDSVDGLNGLSNDQAGEEAKVRQKAKEKLYEILAPFNIKEEIEPSADEIHKAKKKFGL
jgi:hypothetical protein